MEIQKRVKTPAAPNVARRKETPMARYIRLSPQLLALSLTGACGARANIIVPGADGSDGALNVTASTVIDSMALSIAGGLRKAALADVVWLNVVTTGASANRIDLQDAARIIRKAAGLEGNP
jgi:hypothetical protein